MNWYAQWVITGLGNGLLPIQCEVISLNDNE